MTGRPGDLQPQEVISKIGSHLLLVEDNQDDVDLTVLALNDASIANELVVARDGEEALDLIFGTETHEGHKLNLPQLILLDINLPKMSGIEVLKRLREDERARAVAVVMLTASPEEQDMIDSYQSGANSYLQKPIDYDEFVQAVRNAGVYWLLLNRTPW